MKKIITLFFLFATTANLQAQLLKKIKDKVENRAKERVEQKVNNKVNETTDKTVDKTVDPVLNPTLPKKKTGDKTSDTTTTTPTKKEKKQAAANTEKANPETNQPNNNPYANGKTNDFPRRANMFNTDAEVKVPNPWGHWKDADGNRYGFSADIDQYPFIYKVTAEGKTVMYYNDRANKNKTNSNTPMFLEPVMDADVNFYFRHSENNGQSIFRLTNQGNIELVAGSKDAHKTIADGKGSAVKIMRIELLKFLNDGNIYFTEMISADTKFEKYNGTVNLADNYSSPTIIRKLQPDGTVTTLRDKNNNIFITGGISDLELDKEGNIIIASGHIYKLTEGGEKIKLLGTPDPFAGYGEQSGASKQRWVMGDVSKAKVPGPWKIIYNNKGELIIWDYIVQRFAKFDGKTVSAFTGTSDMGKFNKNMSGGAEVLADKDGNASTAQFKSAAYLSVEGDDVYVSTYNTGDMRYLDRNLSIRKISKDGSVKTIMTTTTNKFFGK